MKGGQVFYSTPGGNALFVSFGNLTELAKQSKSGLLNDYRDASIARLRAQANISGRLVVSKELTIGGHRAILSNFRGITETGGVADVWSLDLWCDVKDRYYSHFYGDVVRREEFPDFPSLSSSPRPSHSSATGLHRAHCRASVGMGRPGVQHKVECLVPRAVQSLGSNRGIPSERDSAEGGIGFPVSVAAEG